MTALLSLSALAMITSYVSLEIMLEGRPFFGLTGKARVSLVSETGRDVGPNALYV